MEEAEDRSVLVMMAVALDVRLKVEMEAGLESDLQA